MSRKGKGRTSLGTGTTKVDDGVKSGFIRVGRYMRRKAGGKEKVIHVRAHERVDVGQPGKTPKSGQIDVELKEGAINDEVRELFGDEYEKVTDIRSIPDRTALADHMERKYGDRAIGFFNIQLVFRKHAEETVDDSTRIRILSDRKVFQWFVDYMKATDVS